MVPIAYQSNRRSVSLLHRSSPVLQKHGIVPECRRGRDRRTQDKPTQGECEHLTEGKTRGSVICARHGSGPPWLHLAPATTLVWVTAGEGHMQLTEVTHRASVAARLTVGSPVWSRWGLLALRPAFTGGLPLSRDEARYAFCSFNPSLSTFLAGR